MRVGEIRGRFVATWAVLSLALVGCSRPSAQIGEGPVKVSPSKTPGFCVLHVRTPVTFDQEVPCAGPLEVRTDPTGKIAAFREQGRPWWALRLTTGTRHYVDCQPPFANDPEPDFKKVDDFEDAWPRLAACRALIADPEPVPQWVAGYAQELRSGGSVAQVAALFTRLWKTLEDPVESNDMTSDDPWSVMVWNLLDAKERARLESDVCGALASSRTPPREYVRAARLCTAQSPEIAEAAVRRLRDRFTYPPIHNDSAQERLHAMAFEWAALLALPARAADVATEACAYLEQPRKPSADGGVATVAFAAIALSGHRCPAVARQAPFFDCAPSVRDAGAMQAWLASADTHRRGGSRQRWAPDRAATFVEALAAQGPLPADLAQKVAACRGRP